MDLVCKYKVYCFTRKPLLAVYLTISPTPQTFTSCAFPCLHFLNKWQLIWADLGCSKKTLLNELLYIKNYSHFLYQFVTENAFTYTYMKIKLRYKVRQKFTYRTVISDNLRQTKGILVYYVWTLGILSFYLIISVEE